MAGSAISAAAAPPLLPTPPNTCSPALLPTPPSFRRLIPSPASPAPSIGCFVPSAMSLAPSIRCFSRSPATPSPPGRASASESWVRDKAARSGLAPPSSLDGTKGFMIPGRASLSESWVEDKLAATAPSDAPANSSCGKRSLSLTPTSNTCKKQRYELPCPPSEDSDSDSEPDSEPEFYAGPAFLNAPPASALPIPYFLMRR